MFCLSRLPVCWKRNGFRQIKKILYFLTWGCWRETLSSVCTEMQLLLMHFKRQKASYKVSLKILPPCPHPDFQAKEIICGEFPLSILCGNENPRSVFSFKADSPQGHTHPACQPEGCCGQPLTLPTSKILNKLLPGEGRKQYLGTKASPYKYHLQLTKLFCICASAPN